MKRSEAVKLMVAFEEQAFKRFGYSLSKTEIMDGILLQLEKAGMLPPFPTVQAPEGSVLFGETSGTIKNYCFAWLEESETVGAIPFVKKSEIVTVGAEWEPEDE